MSWPIVKLDKMSEEATSVENNSQKGFLGLFGKGQKVNKMVLMFTKRGYHEIENVGIKGARLAEISQIKPPVPVPEGFSITMDTTESLFGKVSSTTNNKEFRKKFNEKLIKAITELETLSGGCRFGGDIDSSRNANNAVKFSSAPMEPKLPILLAVRASLSVDIPAGPIEPVLYIGMSEILANYLVNNGIDPKWAYNAYRNTLRSYGVHVLGADRTLYQEIVQTVMMHAGVENENELSVPDIMQIVAEFRKVAMVPEDPWIQLYNAMESIHKAWYCTRAEMFKQIHGIDRASRVAIIVQRMVDDKLCPNCGIGAAISRNPLLGSTDYVVTYSQSGVNTLMNTNMVLEEQPGLFYNIAHVLKVLERHFKDTQQIEFTCQKSSFYLLNTTSSRRSIQASITSAVKMVKELILSEEEALMRIDPMRMKEYFKPCIEMKYREPRDVAIVNRLFGRGDGVSYGSVTGQIVLSSSDAVVLREKGISCILCLCDATLDDIEGLDAASGLLTMTGNMASRVAVWMRDAGKPAIVSASDFTIDLVNRVIIHVGTSVRLAEGECITMDGSVGLIYCGKIPTMIPEKDENYNELLEWAKRRRDQSLYSLASSEDEAKEALLLGADGVEIFTEELFFGSAAIKLTQMILLADAESYKAAALVKLQEHHEDSFYRILRHLNNKKVFIRLLNESLAEAVQSIRLPDSNYQVSELSALLNVSAVDLANKIDSIKESNPHLGLRGCKTCLVHPNISVMQVRAIVGAVIRLQKESINFRVSIILPDCFSENEAARVTSLIRETVSEACFQTETTFRVEDFDIVASIANPRACFLASKILQKSSISSILFDLNELTELTFGTRGNQTDKLMPLYIDHQILSRDPFSCVDEDGVIGLVQIAVNKCLEFNPNTKIHVFGVQAAEPLSIKRLAKLGIESLCVTNNIWIPVAAISAAQANILPSQMHLSRFSKPFGPVHEYLHTTSQPKALDILSLP